MPLRNSANNDSNESEDGRCPDEDCRSYPGRPCFPVTSVRGSPRGYLIGAAGA
jgi:hypothetical protein